MVFYPKLPSWLLCGTQVHWGHVLLAKPWRGLTVSGETWSPPQVGRPAEKSVHRVNQDLNVPSWTGLAQGLSVPVGVLIEGYIVCLALFGAENTPMNNTDLFFPCFPKALFPEKIQQDKRDR